MCEMPPGGHQCPTLEVVVLFGPLSGWNQDFLWKHCNGGGCFDHRRSRVRRCPRLMACLVVVSRRRDERIGHPIEHHRRQQIVFREPTLDVAPAITPITTSLQNPGAQAYRRIMHAVRQRLRICRLDCDVARNVRERLLVPFEVSFFVRAISGFRRRDRIRQEVEG